MPDRRPSTRPDRGPAVISEPGCYPEITAEQYHNCEPCSEPSATSTLLREVLKCPAKAWWHSHMNPRREPKDTEALRYGKAMHALLFEQAEFEARFVVLPEDHKGNTNEGKALAKEIKRRGQLPLKADQYQRLLEMREVVLRDPIASASFTGGLFEATLAWRDEETGVWMRCRPDFLPEVKTWVPDYKTTVDASPGPNGFGKSAAGYGYFIQAATYLEGIERVFGEKPRGFYFVAQEKEPPYIVSPLALTDWQLDMGWREMRRAIRIWAECLERDHWPGYVEDVTEIKFPSWAEVELLRRYEDDVHLELT